MTEFAQTERIEGRILGPISPLCKKLIVGVDFGTTFSGVAYAYKAQPGTIRYGAPTAIDMQSKVPTVLLKMPDGTWLFGNEAEKKYHDLQVSSDGRVAAQLFKGFKMALLGKSGGEKDFNTLTAFSSDGRKHKLMELITQSLRILKEFAVARVQTEYGAELQIGDDDIQWVLTVPAIWTEFGKAFMRRAAYKAGMMSTEHSDQLMLVLEPEAASLAVQAGMMDFDILTTGSQFMVLDCGGGTVDITAHEVETVKPVMSMKTIAIPSGGAWGGEYVNQNFKTFLRKLLTPQFYDSMQTEMALEFSEVFAAFERIKVNYNPTEEPVALRLLNVLPRGKDFTDVVEAYNNATPKASEKIAVTERAMRRGYCSMTPGLMSMFFDPMLGPIVEATNAVLTKHRRIKFIILVGGFGASEIVRERIFKEFDGKNGVKCIRPTTQPRPQGAIAHGAVFNGIYQTIVSSRVSPYTYGVGFYGDIFKVAVVKDEPLPYDHKVRFSGIPRTPSQDTITWPVLRSDKEDPKKQSEEHKLGTIPCPCPPGPNAEAREQICIIEFGRAEIRVEIENKEGKKSRGSVSMV